MLLLHYRSLPDGTSLPVDQRWRTIELDPEVFGGLDFESPQSVAAAIHRINDSKVSDVLPFPNGVEVYLTDTDQADHWSLALQVQKAT